MQPWRLIVDPRSSTRGPRCARLAQRERLRQADRFDERARQFLDQKIEGVVEAPLGDLRLLRPRRPATRRSSAAARSPRPTSTAPPARSRTCGSPRAPRGSASAGSASTAPTTCARCSASPSAVDPIAYLCLGWPDERPCRPGLEAAGWSQRHAARRGASCTSAGEASPRRAYADRPAPAARAGRRPASGPDRAARDRRARPPRPARQAGRQPRRARAA